MLEVSWMIRHFYVICFIFVAFVMVGCGSIGRSIVAKQEWSENYVTAEGVGATSPLMIDGSLSTVGEMETPMDAGGATAITEAIVKLPEKKSIRRIVLHTPNIKDFTVYAAGEGEDDWKLLEEVKNNDEKKIVMSVSAVTDKVKVTVRRTSDDTVTPGARGRRRRVRHGRGKIKEIEIYGLVEEGSTEAVEYATAPGIPSAPAQKPMAKPKTSPTVLDLESPQNTYTLSGPIPVKINLKIGPDDLVVLADSVSDEMLRTKLLVKTASAEEIPCSKPTPRISNPRPYRGAGREVMVRDAKTLEADSVVTVDIPNLLEYYPIKEPGNYTIQLDMELAVHSKFVGRIQTQIEDLEMSIRGVSAKSTYSQTERASIMQQLREEIEQLKKKKGDRYLVVGTKGKPLEVSSNVLELVIQ
jgi:hypothetical protein